MANSINVEHYLTLNREALDNLSDVERVRVLGELAQAAPRWLSHARAEEIDMLRASLGSEAEVAAALNVERQAIADLGDGPTVHVAGRYIKPRLLRRGAQLLSDHWPGGSGHTELMQAIAVLNRRGRRSGTELRGAALRIAHAFRYGGDDITEDMMPHEDWRTLRRAAAHAAEVMYTAR